MTNTNTEGQTLPGVVRTITQQQLNAYAGASGDLNPLHLDAAFAAQTQFGGIIAHGMLTLALISEMLAAAYGRSWLVSGALKVRFKGAAYVGDQVETWGKVIRVEEAAGKRRLVCEVGARNRQSSQELISGTATVRLD